METTKKDGKRDGNVPAIIGICVFACILFALFALFIWFQPSHTVGYTAFWYSLILRAVLAAGFLTMGISVIRGVIKQKRSGVKIKRSDKVGSIIGVVIGFAFGIVMVLGTWSCVLDIPLLANPSRADLTSITTEVDDSDEINTYYLKGIDEQGRHCTFIVSSDMYKYCNSGEHSLVTVTFLPNSHVVLSVE